MQNKFDELTKAMAQSVTRRAALKKFGVGLAGMALACFGLANKARAVDGCQTNKDCNWYSKYMVCCKFKSGNICSDKVFCRGKGGQFP
jgi:hypothetical protein